MTTISALPDAPSRSDPSTFATKADAFLGALPTFRTETNTVASEVNTNATNAATSASTASTQATAAAASATAAAGSASTASTQATNAANSASAAATSASAASTSASAAATSATNAANSATAAAASAASIAGGPVTSVNGKTGVAVLNASDVGAASSGAIGSSGLTMSTARIIGRTTAGTGQTEEIAVGSGLSLSAGTLSSTGLPQAGGTLTGALNYATTQTIASAATTDIGAATSNSVIVSGTTTITALGTAGAGAERMVQFSGALTLTHNATSLILPGGANITTAAGDVAYFVSLGSGNWRCSGYQKANGAAIAGGSATLTVSNKTGAYSVVAGDNGTVIRTTSGTGAITLPSCATVGVGFTFHYANETSGTVTLQTVGSDVFLYGSNNQFFATRGQGYSLVVVDASASGKWRFVSLSPISTTGGVALGSTAVASGTNANSIGVSTTASGQASLAIGNNATASSLAATAIGANSSGNGSQAVTGAGATALGGSYASGTDSFAAAIGNNTSTYGAQGANSIAMGSQAKATASSSIAIGFGAVASGAQSLALGGNGVTASGASSVAISGGGSTSPATASADYSFALGDGSLAAQKGKYVYAFGRFSAAGDAQYGLMVLRLAPGSGLTGILTSDAGAPSTTNQLIVASGQAMTVTGMIVGKVTGTAQVYSATFTAQLINNAGTVTLGAAVTLANVTDGITLTTAPTVTADNTNKGLAVTSGAKTATVIRWVCTVQSVELTY